MDSNKSFSPSIPPNLIPIIIDEGKENPEQFVYRVSKSGLKNKETFLNSYDERIHENRCKKGLNLNDIGTYSTSCYLTVDSPLYFLNFLKAKYFDQYPCPCVIMGHTIGGLSQRTIERETKCDKKHIDWWIYQEDIDEIIADFEFYGESKK